MSNIGQAVQDERAELNGFCREAQAVIIEALSGLTADGWDERARVAEINLDLVRRYIGDPDGVRRMAAEDEGDGLDAAGAPELVQHVHKSGIAHGGDEDYLGRPDPTPYVVFCDCGWRPTEQYATLQQTMIALADHMQDVGLPRWLPGYRIYSPSLTEADILEAFQTARLADGLDPDREVD